MHSQSTNEYSRSGQRSYPQYPPQTNVQYPQQTNYQYQPQRELQPPLRTNVEHSPQTNYQYTPQRSLQPPLQTRPQYASDVTFTQQQGAQQQGAYPVTSQSRSFLPESNKQENFEILTSVLPLANPTTQQNRNLVHSSPSYSKTKVYSSQQSDPSRTSIYPTLSTSSSNQYSHSNQGDGGIDQRGQYHRQAPSNREIPNANFDRTMDLLDSYANFETTRRHDVQNGRANVMTVDRVNSNRDHEIPIYNRPDHQIDVRFGSRTTDDLQTQTTEHTLLLNDALKLMMTPYTKSAPLKNEAVDEMRTKILSSVAGEEEIMSSYDDETIETERNDDRIMKEEPIQSE